MAKNNKFILGECEYDPKSRTITYQNGTSHVIGHVQAKLLQLLYKNPDLYFSNEELQRDVWDNRFIANTTIRTTVSYLRKALGESAECKYIDSGRNKGYQFVARVSEITPKRQFKRFYPFAVIALLVGWLFLILLTNPPQINPKIIIPQVLTTLAGQEIYGAVNGKLLVFSHKPTDNQYDNLYFKELGKERYYRLTSGRYHDINPVFSDDGQKLAFNRYDENSCKIMIGDVNKQTMVLSQVKMVFNCHDGPLAVSTAWKDPDNLYLSYIGETTGSYQLFLFNILTQKSSLLPITPALGDGDYYIIKSPKSKKVVFFRNVVGNNTEIWLFNEKTQQSKIIASVPLVLGSAAWTNAGNQLILRTSNGQLSRLELNSGKLSLVYKTNDLIYFPFTINDHSVGFKRGTSWIRDIVQVDLAGRTQKIITSYSSDSYPVYAQNTGDIGFISNRTGIRQVWLLKQSGELTQLTDFTRQHETVDLAISPDGQYLAYTINEKLHIITNKGSVHITPSRKSLYKNPAFSNDSQTLYYSLNNGEQWVIESRELAQPLKTQQTAMQGYVVKPCFNEDCFYLTKLNDPFLYKFSQGKSQNTGVKLNKIENPGQLAIVDGDVYYTVQQDANIKIMKQNIHTKKITHITQTSVPQFAVKRHPLQFLTVIAMPPENNLESIDIN